MSKLLKKKKKKKLNPDKERFSIFGRWSSYGICNLIQLMSDNLYGKLQPSNKGVKPWFSSLRVRPDAIVNLNDLPLGCPRNSTKSVKCKAQEQCSVYVEYDGRFLGIDHLLRTKSCLFDELTDEQRRFQTDLEKACLADHEWANR